jgi:hypothetical protein
MKQTSLFVAADHIRYEQEDPSGKFIVYSDGKAGWVSTPQGIQPIPADVLQSAKGVIFRQTATLMSLSSPTMAGCLRNCEAVAAAAGKRGKKIAVIPAGEQWEGGALRPCSQRAFFAFFTLVSRKRTTVRIIAMSIPA